MCADRYIQNKGQSQTQIMVPKFSNTALHTLSISSQASPPCSENGSGLVRGKKLRDRVIGH